MSTSRPTRTTANLSGSTQQRLNSYALAAAGVGVLALAQPAEAKIVYTPAHKYIGPQSGLALDLNRDGKTDFTFVDSHCSSSCWSGLLSLVPAQQANGFRGYATQGGFVHYVSALVAGVRVGPKDRFVSPPYNRWMARSVALGTKQTYCFGPWAHVTNRYLGLKFLIKGKTHFGWARLSVTCANSFVKAILTGYAYETTPNKSIVAGKTKGPDEIDNSVEQPNAASFAAPTGEPVTLGLLATGSAGLSIWRREEATSNSAVE